ncbi:MAG TPA: glycosyltransferase family 4 protein [Bryobacteraceae bacterium]|nr:glycosyltransferase family 4 protein [Bryobacteraceae bacterium]
MKVLVMHNEYRMAGGEDAVVAAEVRLLREAGVEVLEHFVTNDGAGGFRETVNLVRSSAWSWPAYRDVRRICVEFRPDIAHVHNFWMALSPSAHQACHDEGIATVQTLHNFRLICANALLLRNGRICEQCVGKTPWRGIAHRCYRNSALASAAVVRMLAASRRRRIWTEKTDAFVALSESSRRRFAAAGIPAGKIFIKPNFVPARIARPLRSGSLRNLIYAGRLSPEKGVRLLLQAWARVDRRRAKLIVAGTGPLARELRDFAAALSLGDSVDFPGHISPERIEELLADSRGAILPSLCLENFPRMLVEAFASGRGVIAADIGALGELVEHCKTGLLFRAGDAESLAFAMETILRDDSLASRLGEAAAQEYAEKYTPSRNLKTLFEIYEFARRRPRDPIPPGEESELTAVCR